MKPTDEQFRAIHFEGEHITIRAGAGSGKTGVLVERYLHHVLDEGIPPESILAITFTRKAAAEMRARIVHRLRQHGHVREAHAAQAGPISTVHSFCERTLREYPVEAHLDPKFDVLSLIQSDRVLNSASQMAIGAVEYMSDYAKTVVRRFGADRPWGTSANSTLGTWINDCVKDFRTAGKRMDLLAQYAESPDQVRRIWQEHMEQSISELLNESPPANWRDDFKTLEQLFKDKKLPVPQWLRIQQFGEEAEAAALTCGLAELAINAWQNLAKEMETSHSLDFIALETSVRDMLERAPDLLEGKYKHLIVDEAQDLNPIQHEILSALPCGTRTFIGDAQQAIYSFRGADRRLFLESMTRSVVLPLQINWRSTPPIIEATTQLFQPIWREEFLQMVPARTERRPASADSNDPFEQESEFEKVSVWLLPNRRSQAYEALAEKIEELRNTNLSLKDTTILVRSRQAIDLLLDALREKELPYILGDMTRDYFLRQEIYDLASALLAGCNPHDDLAMLSFLRSPLVGLSFDGIAKLGLHARESDTSVFASLDTVDLSEEDRSRVELLKPWFVEFSRYAPFMQAWQALSFLFAKTHLDARLAFLNESEQLMANSRKLLHLAMENRDMGTMQFALWIENQRHLRTKQSDASALSPDADALTICTVHAAKGLEWKNVIVFDPFESRDSKAKPLFASSADAELIALSSETPALIAHIIAQRKMEAEAEEERRLLYVAMTRARDRLCIAIRKGSAIWDKDISPHLSTCPAIEVVKLDRPSAQKTQF